MEITYYGHSCFGLKLGESNILIDPFISPNPLASHIDINNIDCDYILVSHAHNDHTADVEKIAQRTGAQIISSWEIVTYYETKGLTNGHPMNIGGKTQFPFGLVKMVDAVHSSSFPDGTYGGSAAGFVIESNGKSCYYAGDTALYGDMNFIGSHFDLHVAFLPIGDNFTMGISEALQAAELVDVKKIIGMHYQTFPYIEIDLNKAKAQAIEEGKELILMEIGSSIKL